MITVQLSTMHRAQFMLRQTPAGDGLWDDIRVSFDAPGSDEPAPDWLVVYDHPENGLVTRVPRERRIVFLPEPKSIKYYDRAFIRQFGTVASVSPLPWFKHTVLHTQPCSPWFYGLDLGARGEPTDYLNFQELAQAHEKPHNKGLISAICSTKTLNRNQVRRLRFLQRLKARLGDQLTIFGRGFKPLGDKAEGLDGFRYHLVLENNLERHGWTEKLADPLISGAYPIVAGGPGLDAYFNPTGFTELNIRRPDEAVSKVLETLSRDPATDPQVQLAMAENKRKLMMEHQFFPAISRIISEHAASVSPGEAMSIVAPRKAPFRHLVRPLRPLRPAYDRLYLTLFERS